MLYSNKNKKIALFIPSLAGGGAERVFVNLANEFARRGISVNLVLAKKEGPYLKDVSESVKVIDLKARRVLFAVFPLIKYLRQEKPRVLLSTVDHANIIAVLARFLSRAKIKVIIRVANNLSVSLQGTKGYRWPLRLYGTILFSRFADEIVTVSKGVAEDFAKTAKVARGRIKVIYNPTVTPKIFNKANEVPKIKNRKPSFAKQGTGEDEAKKSRRPSKVVLGVGSFLRQKGFETLIRAFAKVRENKRVKLIILGEGEERKKLESLVKDLKLEEDVDMPGFMENPYAYMAKADIYVLSSWWEGLPNTLIEAMACGTPVVSTDCPSGPREILEDGKYGKLVPVGDVEAMVKAIEETLEDPPDSKKLRERVKAFSLEKAADEYLKLAGYENFIHNN